MTLTYVAHNQSDHDLCGKQPIRFWLMWQTTNQIMTYVADNQSDYDLMADNKQDHNSDLRGR